jgi:hypothetical protein
VTNLTEKLRQSVPILLCLMLVWRYGSQLEGSEFSGGSVTGVLLDMKDLGFIVLVLSLICILFYRKIGAALAVVGSLLCIPLYLYLTFPALSRWIFHREHLSVPERSFVWNAWSVAGIVSLALLACIGIRAFVSRTPHTTL